MDNRQIGARIRAARTERGWTQAQLAETLCVSDRAVSKWERGLGCPDVSLLASLSTALGLDMGSLLSGGPEENEWVKGNMKQNRYYVCPVCGNLIVSTGSAAVSCCGRVLEPLEAQKPDEGHALKAELVEDEWFVTSGHEMTKGHHIAFVAYATGERLLLTKLWPEWDLQLRLPRLGHGLLLWYCTRDGLFRQLL